MFTLALWYILPLSLQNQVIGLAIAEKRPCHAHHTMHDIESNTAELQCKLALPNYTMTAANKVPNETPLRLHNAVNAHCILLIDAGRKKHAVSINHDAWLQ